MVDFEIRCGFPHLFYFLKKIFLLKFSKKWYKIPIVGLKWWKMVESETSGTKMM